MEVYWADKKGGRKTTEMLPVASETVRGGIMVGEGLLMNAESLNVAIAGESVLGGIKVGEGFSMIEGSASVTIEGASAVKDVLSLNVAGESVLGGIKVGINLAMYKDSLCATIPVATDIHRGGIRIGEGLETDPVNFNPAKDLLRVKTASETVKGGVKIGKGLVMDGDTLKIHIQEESMSDSFIFDSEKGNMLRLVEPLNNRYIPPAWKNRIGGIMPSAGLSVDVDGYLSVTFSPYTLPAATTTKLGGIKVGSGLKMTDETLSATYSYTLPTASKTTKGGIKVGTGLSMDGDTLNAFEQYTLPAATTTKLGGVKVGSGLAMTGEVLSATYTLPTASASTKGGVKVGTGLSMAGDTLHCLVENDSFFHVAPADASFPGIKGTETSWKVSTYEKMFVDNVGRNSQNGDIVHWQGNDNVAGYAYRFGNKWFNLGVDEADGNKTRTWGDINPFLSLSDRTKLDNADDYILPVASSTKLGGVIVGDGLTITSGTLSAEQYTLPTAGVTVKGGIKVGSGLGMSNETLNVTLEPYTLPTASKTVKGGVKVGTGLTMSGDTLNAVEQYTLPTASKTVKGGIKVGSGLGMSDETLNITLEPYTLPTASKTVKGGIIVGTGLTMSGDTLNAVEQYTLPTASKTTKGGIVVGDGLTISGGTLTAAEQYTLPTASTSTKGGIKVGNGLKMNNGFLNVSYFSIGTKASTVEGAMWITDTDLPEPEPFEPEEYMTSYLPFANSPTEDLCGKTWTSDGAVTVRNGMLILNSGRNTNSTLTRQEAITFTGQPLTFSFKMSFTVSSIGALFLFRILNSDEEIATYVHQTYLTLEERKAKDRDFSINTQYISKFSDIDFSDGVTRHIEVDYDGATWYLFVNGKLIGSHAFSPAVSDYTLVIGGSFNTQSNSAGTMDDFKFYDGVALHTSNFTP